MSENLLMLIFSFIIFAGAGIIAYVCRPMPRPYYAAQSKPKIEGKKDLSIEDARELIVFANPNTMAYKQAMSVIKKSECKARHACCKHQHNGRMKSANALRDMARPTANYGNQAMRKQHPAPAFSL